MFKTNKFTLNPTKLIGGILFIIAWYTGAVDGVLAWALLFMQIDFTFTWNK